MSVEQAQRAEIDKGLKSRRRTFSKRVHWREVNKSFAGGFFNQRGSFKFQASSSNLWLVQMVNPKITFRFYEVPMGKDEQGNGVCVTMIEIPAAETEPTKSYKVCKFDFVGIFM